MKLLRLILIVACVFLSSCNNNNKWQLKLSKENLADCYVENKDSNIIISFSNDTLLDLVYHNGQYISRKSRAVVLATRECNGYDDKTVEYKTDIRGNKQKGFISSNYINNSYLDVEYDSCFTISKVTKRNRIVYGIDFPDDTEKDILIIDTAYLNKRSAPIF